jgi:replicative DNA helicase
MNTLPVSVESERAALGAVLLDPKQLATLLQSAAIEDFCLSSHREILRVMVNLDRSQTPLDVVTLVTELDQAHKLESVGGAAYVGELLVGVPDNPNPNTEAYAVKIHDLARARALHFAASVACSSIEQGEPVDDVLGRLQQRELELIRANTRGARPIKAAALDFLNQFCAACDADGPDIKFTTSLPDLDSKTGGLQGLVYVGGRTGGGKSTFLQQMAFAQAKEGHWVYFATLEMTERVVLARGASMLTDIPTKSILNPRYLSKEDRRAITEAVAEIQTWPIVIDDTGGLEIHQLLANCRAQINKGVECAYIDYLQMIGCREYTRPYDKVTAISGALRDLAKTSDVPVVAACQLSRPENVNDRPTLFDCKESGAIENDASLLLAVYRPKEGERYTGEDEILVLKQRNGTTGPVHVRFLGQRMKFEPRYTECNRETRAVANRGFSEAEHD